MIHRGDSLANKLPNAALVYYQRAYALSKRSSYRVGYVKSMYHVVTTLNLLGRYPQARQLAEEAVQRAHQDTSKIADLATSYLALAITAWQQGELAEAVRAYQRTGYYARRLKHAPYIASIHNNLGLIYRQQELHALSLQEFQTGLRYFQKANMRRNIAETLFNIGSTYAVLDSNQLAKRYFRETERYLDSVQDLDLSLALQSNLGMMARKAALPSAVAPVQRRALRDSALAHYRRALQMSRQTQNAVEIMHQYSNLGSLHIDQARYRQARPFLQQAVALLERNGNAPDDKLNIYRELVRLNEGTGNYRAAYWWRERYEQVDSTLNNQRVTQLLQGYELKIKQAEGQAKLAAKQKQIDRLEAEQRRQGQQAQLAGVSGAATAALLLLGMLYYRQRQRTHATALLALQREQDLLAVHAEVQGQTKERVRIAKEMHDDMGASLTVIGLLSEVMKTRPETAAAPEVGRISELSADLISTMNQVIWSLNPSNDSLNGLIAYVRVYAREFLDNAALHLRIEAEEAEADVRIDGDDRRNVFLAVKEALHNVVKHAGASRVTLRLQARDGALGIEVCDDGRGFAADNPAPKAGRNGLANMAHRLREAGGTCEVHATAGGGTCVVLHYLYPVLAPAAKILQA